MIDDETLTPEERNRRLKISIARKKYIEKKRQEGYRRYIQEKRKKKKEEEKRKAREKAKEKKRKEKERLKKKNKKKVGRPKKRGPKKKYWKKRKKLTNLKPKKTNAKPPYRYKVISCRNGKQNKFIGSFRTSEEAYECLNRLKMEDEKIIFPVMLTGTDFIENSIDEYIIIEKSDAENSILRNEYGKLVEQKTNIEGWIVLDKFRYRKEETFGVWGYEQWGKERKTFQWIYTNILLDGLETGLNFKRVLTYKNKVIIKNDSTDMDIIITKSEGDAIRFYNLLKEWIERDKIKQVLFIGDYSTIGEKRRKLEDEIMALTGWTRKKIQMKNTSFFLKKHTYE